MTSGPVPASGATGLIAGLDDPGLSPSILVLAAYAASKANVLSLREALHVELALTVGATVLSPGYMETASTPPLVSSPRR
jgi:NAD(P)-dependent dehydrogenase (short-subunit alcohol dehydrogenase family)